MNKEDIIRESRHIVAVFSKENKPTGYYILSNSTASQVVRYILKKHWVEKVDEHDGFIFVKPTDTLLKLSNGGNGQ